MSKFTKLNNFSRYSIDQSGRVRNDVTGKLLSHTMNSTGYKRVSLYSDQARKYKQCSLHRLLASTFIPNPLNLECVDHIDHNKLNNTLANLQWVSKQHNTQRAYDAGMNSNKKLTNADKAAIRTAMTKAVRGTTARLAEKYGVHPSRITQIHKGI